MPLRENLREKIFKRNKQDKSLESSLGRYTLLDSMTEGGPVVAAFSTSIIVAVLTGNILYSIGACLLTDVGTGKLHNMIYHSLERKFENNYGSY